MESRTPRTSETTKQPFSPHPPVADGEQVPAPPPHEDEFDVRDEIDAESFPASDPPPGPATIGR
jgi:hypothetical protein